MTASEREEFWTRIHALVERYAAESAGCDAIVNRFERRRWDLKFSRRRAGDSPASVSLFVAEHAPSKDVMLLAVTSTLVSGESEAAGVPSLIPVLFSRARNRFSLHADHGPVDEEQIPRSFSDLAAAILTRILTSSDLPFVATVQVSGLSSMSGRLYLTE